MIFLDTTFLVALIDRRDALHDRATAWSAKLNRDVKITTEHVLVECTNLLSAPLDRGRAVALVERLPTFDDHHVEWANRSLFDEGMRLYADRPDKQWSLTDCISFVVMQRHGVTQSLTYDHHFEQAGFEALLRRMPS